MLTEKDLKSIEQEFIELAQEHDKLWDILPGNDEAYARCQEIVKRQRELSKMIYDGMQAIIQGSERISIPMKPRPRRQDVRFWIDERPEKDPFRWGCAVVDEEAGGIIAYFPCEADAKIFIRALEREE